jgi:hypothetical protein
VILNLLARHKSEIVALLRQGRDGWSREDWQVFFEERARSPPERCLACGGGDHPYDALLPHGFEPIGHAWLHTRCWPAWRAARRAEAVAALEAMGDRDTRPGFQTISIKMEARDGRLRIGAAERLRAQHS